MARETKIGLCRWNPEKTPSQMLSPRGEGFQGIPSLKGKGFRRPRLSGKAYSGVLLPSGRRTEPAPAKAGDEGDEGGLATGATGFGTLPILRDGRPALLRMRLRDASAALLIPRDAAFGRSEAVLYTAASW
jgi:hypothetical protein